MRPKEGRCPQCRHSDAAIDDVGASTHVAQEFAARYAIHARNKGIEVMLGFALGAIGLLTAMMWGLAIFMGSIGAIILVGVFTLVTAFLTGVRFFSERWFPTHLLCPSCDARLEALNDIGDDCPACNAVLRVDFDQYAEAEMAATS